MNYALVKYDPKVFAHECRANKSELQALLKAAGNSPDVNEVTVPSHLAFTEAHMVKYLTCVTNDGKAVNTEVGLGSTVMQAVAAPAGDSCDNWLMHQVGKVIAIGSEEVIVGLTQADYSKCFVPMVTLYWREI
jgi:hypothetical protein